MVHKKQEDPVLSDDSTASCHSYNEDIGGNQGKSCTHLNKCIDLNNIRNNLRNKELSRKCQDCTKEKNNSLKSEIPIDINQGVWLCLQCAYRGCTSSQENHALLHNSPSHHIALHVYVVKVYCFECKLFLESNASKPLSKTVKFIKKKFSKLLSHDQDILERNSFKKANIKMVSPRGVRGLTNNGNTCYINVTLQCLAQTPYFLYILESMNTSGTTVNLPGNLENEKEPLSGELGKNGFITENLLQTIYEINNKQKLGSFNPNKLINKVKQKCAQFRDYDQQDAHEFIRQLLDLIKTEDLQRYWRIILHSCGFNEKTDPSIVNTNSKEIVKFYGHQAAEFYLHPDDVFKGKLVSIIKCQSCENISYKTEPFLDLSLPINENKPHPPTVRRKTKDFEENVNKTKRQSNKEKKNQRKQARKNKRNHFHTYINESTAILEENTLEKDELDADIEDNVENEKNFESINGTLQIETSPKEIQSPEENEDESTTVILNDQNFSFSSNFEMTPKESNFLNGNEEVSSNSQILNFDRSFTPPVSETDCIFPSSDKHSDSNPSTPPSLEPERPLSRISFYNEDKSHSQESPSNDNIQNGIFCIFKNKQKKNIEEQDIEEKNSYINDTTKNNSTDVKDKIIESNDERYTNFPLENENEKKELFKTISSKSINGDQNTISLECCFNRFTSIEMMTGNNKVSCPNCSKNSGNSQNVLTNSIKQLLVSHAPPVLILHLKRFYFDEIDFKKIMTHIKFDMHLDIAPFCSSKFKASLLVNPNDTGIPYQLYAIIEHRGSLHNGHYIAYVKVSNKNRTTIQSPYWNFFNISELQNKIHNFCSKDNDDIQVNNSSDCQWYYISDTEVKQVTEERVLNASAYVLFYERMFQSS